MKKEALKVGLDDLVRVHGRDRDKDDPKREEEHGRGDLQNFWTSKLATAHSRMSPDVENQDGDLKIQVSR